MEGNIRRATAKYYYSPAVVKIRNIGFKMWGLRPLFQQIAALDIFTVETDGMGCTVADHCYYGHTVGASYGKCFL